MSQVEVYAGLRQHLHRFFAGHICNEYSWTVGPAPDQLPRLRVAEFAPGPRSRRWVYVSLGAWEQRDDPRLEFLIVAPDQDQRHVELLTMTAWYHRHEGLGLGHMFPIGEPWLNGSACEFMLVSLPYTFGPELEVCKLPSRELHILWLLPITAAEREFGTREGLEKLEQRFEECGLKYWAPDRASVV